MSSNCGSSTQPPWSLKERASIQGFFSAVWGVAALAGPALGALLVNTLGWRSIFLALVIAGLSGIVIIWRLLPETLNRRAAEPVLPLRLFANREFDDVFGAKRGNQLARRAERHDVAGEHRHHFRHQPFDILLEQSLVPVTVADRLLDLFARIHHNRALPRYRLLQGLAGDQ